MNKFGLSSEFFIFKMLYFYWKCYIKSNICISLFITTKYQMLYFLSKHIDQWLDVESVWYIGLSLV